MNKSNNTSSKNSAHKGNALKLFVQMVLSFVMLAGVIMPSNASFVGVQWNGTLWNIEPDGSGPIATGLGDIGPTGFNSMARGSDGTLYTILTRNLPIDDAALFAIDMTTATATLLHQFTLPPEPSPFTSARINALAFNHANGLLYFVDVPVSDGSGVPRISELYTLDPVTGNYTLIGSLGLGAATALAFDSNGILYGWVVDTSGAGNNIGLATIDIATGIATDINAFVGGGALDVQTLAFDLEGNLFGANEYFYEIDLLTGQLSNGQLIFNSADIRGMEFTLIPIPGAFTLMLSAGLICGWLGRKSSVS